MFLLYQPGFSIAQQDVCVCVCREREREGGRLTGRLIYFKELAYTVVEQAGPKSAGRRPREGLMLQSWVQRLSGG